MVRRHKKHYARGLGRVALTKQYRRAGKRYKLKRILKIQGAILGELAEIKGKKRKRHRR